jgi:hypothetical protein
MTIQKSHLQIALAILVVSVIYNFWVYLRPTRSVQSSLRDQASLEAQIARAAMGATGNPTGTPQTLPVSGPRSSSASYGGSIPAPPPVDTTTPPSWSRDPFLFGNETRGESARVAAVAPDPIVRSILFSSNRRLAVVDGKILGIGDALGTSRVVDITRDAVVFRTASGEQLRVALHGQPASAGIRR